MKSGKALLAFIMAGILCLSAASCGSEEPGKNAPGTQSSTEAKKDETAKSENEKKAGIAGAYKMISMLQDGEEVTDITQYAEYGVYYYMVVGEDGTAYLDMSGEKEEMIYDESAFYTANDSEKSVPSPYTFADGTLTMNASDGSTLSFCRLNDEELAYYTVPGSATYTKIFRITVKVTGFSAACITAWMAES